MLAAHLSTSGRGRLFDRPPRQDGQIADQAVGQLARNRHLAIALEFLDRGLRVGADNAGRLELAIAIFGQSALDGRRCAASTRSDRQPVAFAA